MAMETIDAAILAGIANVSHDITVTAQTIALYHLFAETSGSNFGRNGIGNDAKYIPASGIHGINAACDQTVRIVTVSAIGSLGMRRVQIGVHLIIHGVTLAAEFRLCQTQGRHLDQQHPEKP